MKNKRILGLSVAALGAIVATTTSYALYVNEADPSSFDITIETHQAAEGEIQYGVGDITKPVNKLDPKEHRSVDYIVPLKATYPSNVIAQDLISGKLKVTLDNKTKDVYTVSAKMTGYTNGTLGYNKYENNNIAFGDGNFHDLTVSTDGTQELVITVSYKEIVTEENFLSGEYAEADFALNVWWGESETMKQAQPHIVGDGNSWKDVDEFRMVENIQDTYVTGADKSTYVFKDLTGFTKMKVHHYEDWVGSEGKAPGGADLTGLTKGSKYLTTYNPEKSESGIKLEGNKIFSK